MTNTTVALTDKAQDLGTERGTTGGSWVIDGNTSEETLRECLRMDDDGDPEWWDTFGPSSPPLSGEWESDMTPKLLLVLLGLDIERVNPDVETELCSAFEEAFNDAWRDEVTRAASANLPD